MMDEATWLALALRAVAAWEAYVRAYQRDVAMAERNERRITDNLAEVEASAKKDEKKDEELQ